MGIFIHMDIADTVTQEEWTKVYEKSLLMAKKFGFFDFGNKLIHGENVFCIFPTEEKDFNGRTGWRAIGSFPEYKRAEDQFTKTGAVRHMICYAPKFPKTLYRP